MREIREELGAEIEDVRRLGTLENLFVCEGETGHEIVLIYDAVFADRSLYDRAVLHGYEQGAATEEFTAEWKTLDELASGPVRLVPEGLAAFLRDWRWTEQRGFGGRTGRRRANTVREGEHKVRPYGQKRRARGRRGGRDESRPYTGSELHAQVRRGVVV